MAATLTVIANLPPPYGSFTLLTSNIEQVQLTQKSLGPISLGSNISQTTTTDLTALPLAQINLGPKMQNESLVYL